MKSRPKSKIYAVFFLSLILPLIAIGCNQTVSTRFESRSAKLKTISDALGRKVSLVVPPQRIVSLSPEATELIYFLGADNRLVAVSKQCNYPPLATKLPRIGGFNNFSIERVLSFRPDLVVATTNGNPRDKVEELIRQGIPVFVLNIKRLNDIPRNMRLLAEVLYRDVKHGKFRISPSELSRTLREFALKHKFAHCQAIAAIQTDPLFLAGKDTLISDIIELVGAQNLAAHHFSGYKPVALEAAVALEPQIVFLVMQRTTKTDSELLQRIPWNRTPNLCYLPEDQASRGTPRILEAVQEAARCVKTYCQ